MFEILRTLSVKVPGRRNSWISGVLMFTYWNKNFIVIVRISGHLISEIHLSLTTDKLALKKNHVSTVRRL